jgi:hypothetical protein
MGHEIVMQLLTVLDCTACTCCALSAVHPAVIAYKVIPRRVNLAPQHVHWTVASVDASLCHPIVPSAQAKTIQHSSLGGVQEKVPRV